MAWLPDSGRRMRRDCAVFWRRLCARSCVGGRLPSSAAKDKRCGLSYGGTITTTYTYDSNGRLDV